MAKHSPVGPSSCEQFWNCPGSVQMQAGLPDESSEYAKEGTIAHALAARCLTARRHPSEFVGEVFEDGDAEMEVTDEMAAAVAVYYEHIVELVRSKSTKAHPITVEVEKKLSNPDLDKEAFGTCDCFFTTPDGTVYVFDYKHGAGVPVDAKDNKQMLYYAAIGSDYVMSNTVIMTIVQPRAQGSTDPVKTDTVTVDEVAEFAQELKAKIAAARAKKPTVQAGKWCKFCRGKFKCPAFTKTLHTLFPVESAEELLPDLPLEQYGAMYNRAVIFKDRFDAWFKQLEALLYTYAEAGTPAPGTKLVKGRKTRKWADEKATEQALSEYGEAIYTKPKLLSPAQMEKVIDKEELEDLVTETASLKLAPDSDHRDAVKTIEQLFDVIEE